MAIGPNANSGVDRGRVVHGARAYIVLNGAVVGYAQNATAGENYNMSPVDVLDSIEVEEFVPVAYTVTISMTRLKLAGESLKQIGLFEAVENVLFGQEFTIELKDRPTDSPIATIEGCRAQATNFTIQKGVLTVDQLTFVGKRMRDSAGLV